MKKNILKSIGVGGLLILGITSFGFITYEKGESKTHYVHANFIADFNDDKKILGFSDNVFAGKIIKNLGNAKIDEGGSKIPSTLFEVEVLYNIKGNLKGNVIIKQEAGYDKYGDLFIPEDTNYMQEGEIYLVSVKGDSFTVMSHPNGSHLLLSGDKKDKGEIKEILKNNKKIIDWRKAYKEEIYYEGEIKLGTEKNAYNKLSKDEKEKFEDINYGFTY